MAKRTRAKNERKVSVKRGKKSGSEGHRGSESKGRLKGAKRKRGSTDGGSAAENAPAERIPLHEGFQNKVGIYEGVYVQDGQVAYEFLNAHGERVQGTVALTKWRAMKASAESAEASR